MKKTFYKRLVQTFLFATMFMLGNNAWADTVTEGFDNYVGYGNGLPDGWNYAGTASIFEKDIENYHSKKPSIGINPKNTDSYLITPMLQGDFNFWLRNYTTKKQATVTAYACTFDNGTLTLGTQINSETLSSGTSSWNNVKFNSPTATRIALLISQAYFDDFTYTPYVQAEGASLAVRIDNKVQTSGSDYNFGLIEANTTAKLTLINNGTVDYSININTPDGFTTNEKTASIKAGEEKDITLTMTGNTDNGVLTITADKDDLTPFTLNLF